MGQQTNGKSRAGTSRKFHAVITHDGKHVEGLLTGGAAHDVTVAAELSEDSIGCKVIGDCGYNSDEFRKGITIRR
ncbi:MAG: hypothetical protein LBD93_09175 [Treponema sp.]|jgi:hypothetical protein|nr:hypothetical protein [Treponema sp.]